MRTRMRCTVALAMSMGLLAAAACSGVDTSTLFDTSSSGQGGGAASSSGGEGGATASSGQGGEGEGGATASSGQGGEGEGGAGTGAAPGTGGWEPPTCGDEFVDCDGEEENSCEVNVTRDAANCSACGVECGGTCQDGRCVAIATHATEQAEPLFIATAARNVFWTNLRDGTVMQWSPGASAPIALAEDQRVPAYIKADTGHVYWANQGDSGEGNGSVMRAPVGGGEEPSAIATGQAAPFGVAIDDEFVYWTNRERGGSVMRARKDTRGGRPQTIASAVGVPNDLAVDATHVYFTNRAQGGRVMSVPKGSMGETPPTELANEQGDVREIAIDARYVYWTNGADGDVMRAPKAGGEATRIATGPKPRGIAVDESGVYWADPDTPAIMKLWPDGVVGVFAYYGPWSTLGIALDEERVYWTNSLARGTIISAAKLP